MPLKGMNKSELIETVSQETQFRKQDVAKVLESITGIVERTLRKGGKVAVTGFGCFWLSKRPRRVGINPATKERITLPAVSIPRFKAGKHLRDKVRTAGLV